MVTGSRYAAPARRRPRGYERTRRRRRASWWGAGHPAAAGATAAWTSWTAVAIGWPAVTIPMATSPSSGRPGPVPRG